MLVTVNLMEKNYKADLPSEREGIDGKLEPTEERTEKEENSSPSLECPLLSTRDEVVRPAGGIAQRSSAVSIVFGLVKP